MPEKEKNITDNIQIRSEQVQEILNAPPVWMIRWGNTLILFLIIGLLALSWVIKYPDVIPAKIIINSTNPLENFFASKELILDTVLVKPNELVVEGQLLYVLEHSGDYQDILRLKTIVEKNGFDYEQAKFPIEAYTHLDLGYLTSYFALFKRDYIEYRDYPKERKNLENILESFNILQKQLGLWEVNHVRRSAKNGSVVFYKTMVRNTHFKENELILSIVPEDLGVFQGHMKIPEANIEQVKLGQQVNMSLGGHRIVGNVSSISKLKYQDGNFNVSVNLPKNFMDSFSKEAVFQYEFVGSAQILMEDLRLIERFFSQIRNYFK